MRKFCKCGCEEFAKKGNEYINGHNGKKKYHLNENYFEKIDNQEKAYFLGFMFADGGIHSKRNQCSITLEKKDKKILERFQNLLKTNRPLFWRKKYRSWRLSLSSRKMKNDLIKAGCIPQKTFKLIFPHWLEKNLKSHFIRGYLDGDGCVSIHFINNHKQKSLRVTILGRENFLKNILNLSNIRGHIIKERNQRIWRLRFCSSFAVSFCNWIYKDATIYLERKYNKFLEYLKNS